MAGNGVCSPFLGISEQINSTTALPNKVLPSSLSRASANKFLISSANQNRRARATNSILATCGRRSLHVSVWVVFANKSIHNTMDLLITCKCWKIGIANFYGEEILCAIILLVATCKAHNLAKLVLGRKSNCNNLVIYWNLVQINPQLRNYISFWSSSFQGSGHLFTVISLWVLRGKDKAVHHCQ